MSEKKQWADYFLKFFEANKNKVTSILDASSCRELWLQGELFLYSGGTIQPNSRDFPGLRVDLHGKNVIYPEMIAELKVIGYQGYACSDVLGQGGTRSLNTWLKNGDMFAPRSCDPLKSDKKLAHSLLKDYKKLCSINKKSPEKSKEINFDGEKYLVLIIPHRQSSAASRGSKRNNVMKDALHKVHFTENEDKRWSKKYGEDFTVRIWLIQNPKGAST